MASITESEDAGINGDAVLQTAERDMDSHGEQHSMIAPTAQEIEVATRLVRAHRIKLFRRQHVSREEGTAAEYSHIYKSYQANPIIKEMSRRYRLLFLGPIPLAFLSIRTMATHAMGMKAQARLRMSLAPHSEYETALAQVNHAS